MVLRRKAIMVLSTQVNGTTSVPVISWTPVLRGAQPVCGLGNNAGSKTEMSLLFTD